MPKLNLNEAREKFWRSAIARQIESGLSQKRFCEREKISANSFSAWKISIRQQDEGKKPSPKQPAVSDARQPEVPPFIPVVVSETGHQFDLSRQSAVAEVRFAHIQVSIFAGADTETLCALFSACRECLE